MLHCYIKIEQPYDQFSSLRKAFYRIQHPFWFKKLAGTQHTKCFGQLDIERRVFVIPQPKPNFSPKTRPYSKSTSIVITYYEKLETLAWKPVLRLNGLIPSLSDTKKIYSAMAVMGRIAFLQRMYVEVLTLSTSYWYPIGNQARGRFP